MPRTNAPTATLGELAVNTWFTLANDPTPYRVKHHWSTGVEIVQANSWAEKRVLSPNTPVTEL